MSESNKRARVLIDSTVQWSLGRRMALHWFAFFGMLVGINVVVRSILAIPDSTISQALQQALLDQLPQISIMLLALPIFVLDTVKFSNRFAGPIFRLSKSLETLGAGTPMRPIKFRNGDFWMDMAEKFNKVLARVNQLETRNRELEAECRRLKEQVNEPADLEPCRN